MKLLQFRWSAYIDKVKKMSSVPTQQPSAEPDKAAVEQDHNSLEGQVWPVPLGTEAGTAEATMEPKMAAARVETNI